MAIHIVRLGAPRTPGEGLRIGTVRRPPRGVRKADYAARDYYDVWLPNLAPSSALLGWAQAAPLAGKRWQQFARRYLAEMARADASRLLDTLALLSRQTNFAVGCYCDTEANCHRSLLRQLFEARGSAVR